MRFGEIIEVGEVQPALIPIPVPDEPAPVEPTPKPELVPVTPAPAEPEETEQGGMLW
jgi:hypothetical protein